MNLIVNAASGPVPAYAYTGGKPLDPTLPCVVFCHGALHDHSVWTLLARWCAHHGHGVLAIDLPGHGRSPGPMPDSVEASADWLLALLAAAGVFAEVVSFHTVKPLDTDYLQLAASRFKLLVTVEEHSRIGGFGSAVAEWRMALVRNVAQLAFGTDDVFMHEVGSQAYARKKYGLTADNIAATTLAALRA